MVRDAGAPSVQLTRILLQPPEAVPQTSGYGLAAPRIPHEIRRLLFAVTTVALVVGAPISPGSSQSSDTPPGVQPSDDAAERRELAPDSTPAVDGDLSPTSPSRDMRVAPWRGWPRSPGNGMHDGWTMEGAPFLGPDGRTCWPHGDHVHCR